MKVRDLRRTTIAGVGVAVAGLAVIAAASTPTAAGFGSGRRLSAEMNGAAEVPGPGDPDGTGRIEMRVNASRRQICYELTVSKITPATDAFIQNAPAGASGPVVVQLVPPGPEVVLSTGEVTGGRISTCVFVETEVARDIIKRPADYYVNVLNAGFLAGAVRGQLGK
jgi:hypothetical protein